MNRRVQYYLAGVLIGCVALMFLPRPFSVNRQTVVENIAEQSGDYPVELTDGYGREVAFRSPPRRVVSLAPSITETIYALGGEEQLIAVTEYCDYPGRAANKEVVGGISTPSLEKILALQPDAVIGTVLTPESVYAKLSARGIPAIAFAQGASGEGAYGQVVLDIWHLSHILNRRDPGKDLVARLNDARHEAMQTGEASGEAPRVLFLYSVENLSSAGKGSWVGDMLELLGAHNVAADAASPWPRLNAEFVVSQRPEIIVMAVPREEETTPGELATALVKEHPVFEHLDAVKEGRVVAVEADWLNRPGPRMALALKALEKAIYPASVGQDGQ